MTLLFEAKTQAAFSFKILIDVLNHYLQKKGFFVINKEGIFLANATSGKEDIFCDVKLLAENFQQFTLYGDDIHFSINLSTFYNEMLKKVKKKDTITLQILEEDHKLFMKVTKESGDKENQSSAKTAIVLARHVNMTPPGPYGKPINILSKTFQSSCREITKPSNKTIEITCWNDKKLRFYVSKDGIVDTEATFGSQVEANSVETFKGKCSALHILKPVKLAGLNETIKIYVNKELPIYYKMNVGSLGEIGIYIKTDEQVKSDKDTADDEEEKGE